VQAAMVMAIMTKTVTFNFAIARFNNENQSERQINACLFYATFYKSVFNSLS